MKGAPRRWPLILLALPASVAVWSGWVKLGEMTGFGVVKVLPGILDDFEINTAVTLPIGVESYSAFALGVWLSTTRAVSDGTRRFAKWSAVGSLLLGMLGQVAFHLLEAAGYTSAPWQITTVVACLPVAVLGMGAALAHMLARDAAETVPGTPGTPVGDAETAFDGQVQDAPEDAPGEPDPAVVDTQPSGFEPVPVHVPGTAVDVPGGGVNPRYKDHEDGDGDDTEPQVNDVPDSSEAVPDDPDLRRKATSVYFSDLANGAAPTVRQIKNELGVGTDRARALRAYLTGLIAD